MTVNVQVQYRSGDAQPWRIVEAATGRTLGATDGSEDDAHRMAAQMAAAIGRTNQGGDDGQ